MLMVFGRIPLSESTDVALVQAATNKTHDFALELV